MKKTSILFFIFLTSFIFLEQKINAAPIDEGVARTVAENFINHLGQSAS